VSTPGVLDPYPPDLNIWHAPPGYGGRDPDPAFARLAEAVRTLQDTFTAARPPGSDAALAAEEIELVTARLAEFAVDEPDQVAGRRLDLPGRGQTLSPPFYADEWDRDSVRGRVTFTRFYLGGNGAVHGGAVPMFFDDVLGRLANVGGRKRARTAYLNVDYRAITPVGREVSVLARFEREEGRKRFLVGELREGDVLLAEAHGLFVELRPGQP
jgi:acyl-coenzyme A thioesterase PaaI-like protein